MRGCIDAHAGDSKEGPGRVAAATAGVGARAEGAHLAIRQAAIDAVLATCGHIATMPALILIAPIVALIVGVPLHSAGDRHPAVGSSALVQRGAELAEDACFVLASVGLLTLLRRFLGLLHSYLAGFLLLGGYLLLVGLGLLGIVAEVLTAGLGHLFEEDLPSSVRMMEHDTIWLYLHDAALVVGPPGRGGQLKDFGLNQRRGGDGEKGGDGKERMKFHDERGEVLGKNLQGAQQCREVQFR